MTARRLLPLATLIVAAVLPWLTDDFGLSLAIYVGLSALVALGLTLLTGIGGIASFGQSAYVGLGAYVSAWTTLTLGWSP